MFKAANRIILLSCLTLFSFQCFYLLYKFQEGGTTTSIRYEVPDNGSLELPRISICPVPFTSPKRMKDLGLAPDAWDIYKYEDDNGEEWPIKGLADEDLYNKSVFGFGEIFSRSVARHIDPKKSMLNVTNVKEMNAWHNGKCFTFNLDGIYFGKTDYFRLHLNDVLADEGGYFTIFIHDKGMEMSLINQFWLNSFKYESRLSPGTTHEFLVSKVVKHQQSTKSEPCRDNWTSEDFYQCVSRSIEDKMSEFPCRTPYDLVLDQQANSKPFCTDAKTTRTQIDSQRKLFIQTQDIGGCPEPCTMEQARVSKTTYASMRYNYTRVFVTLATTKVTIEEETLMYSLPTLVSALGGNLGLFLGFSVLDIARQISLKVLGQYCP